MLTPSSFLFSPIEPQKEAFAPLPKRACLEPDHIQELIEIANRVPSKSLQKKVHFFGYDEVRFFQKNQSPVQFTPFEKLDSLDQVLPYDLNYEKCSDEDFARFKVCDIHKELNEKKTWDRLLEIISQKPLCRETVKKRFYALYTSVFFKQEILDRYRDMSKKNEIEYDTMELLKKAFIPFYLNTKNSLAPPLVEEIVKGWIEEMLLAPIYTTARSYLLELLPELEPLYEKSFNRARDILAPPLDDTSPSFQISCDFWVRFLGKHPCAMDILVHLLQQGHPILSRIDEQMHACADGNALDKTLAFEAYTLFFEAVKLEHFSYIAPFANIEQVLKLVSAPLKDHSLIEKWKKSTDFSDWTLESLESLKPGIAWNYLQHVLSCKNPVARDLKLRILFEYALHKIAAFPANVSKKEFQKILTAAVESFPLINFKNRDLFDYKPFFNTIFCDSDNFPLVKRFWYTLFQKFPDLKTDPHFLSLYQSSIVAHTTETTKPL